MRQNRILKVGLTGGIGTGKSTVSRLISAYGIRIIDADVIARRVLENHPDLLLEIKEHFGGEYFDEYGNLKRRELGKLIFSNKEKKLEYEAIIIPYIKADIYRAIDEYDKTEEEFCIVDAPTLIESGLYKDMDVVLVVSVDEEVQIQRVINRDCFTREDAVMRINNQMSTIEKCKYADFVIDNNGNFKETEKQVQNIVSRLHIIRGKNGSKEEKEKK